MNVRDLMTRDVVVVAPETPLKEVARLLVEHRISGVPVVDADRRVLGVVSEADFLDRESRASADERHSPLRWLLDLGHGDRDRRRLEATTAGEAMSTPARTIDAGRPLSEAARLMSETRFKRLPVVEGDRLVGIITRSDVVRAFARTDDELFAAVERALHAVDGLRVLGVEEGVARLGGTVASHALATTVRRVVAGIDGIVAVDDRELAWIEGPNPEVVPGWTGSEPGMEPGSRSN